MPSTDRGDERETERHGENLTVSARDKCHEEDM